MSEHGQPGEEGTRRRGGTGGKGGDAPEGGAAGTGGKGGDYNVSFKDRLSQPSYSVFVSTVDLLGGIAAIALLLIWLFGNGP